MSRRNSLLAVLAGVALQVFAESDPGEPLSKIPILAGETVLYDAEVKFGYRGKVGVYQMPPSQAGIYLDEKNNYPSDSVDAEEMAMPEPGKVIVRPLDEMDVVPIPPPQIVATNVQATTPAGSIKLAAPAGTPEGVAGSGRRMGQEIARPNESICVMYDFRGGRSFCGAYIIMLGDISGYQCLSFMIRGETGGETFELGMNDTISNKREDAVVIGSIYRYLPGGVTTNWQQVIIPVADFFGPDLSRVYSLVFMCNEIGKGKYWMDQLRFHKSKLVDRQAEIYEKGFLLLDNFDHSDVNLVGSKCGAYKKLPSVCKPTRVEEGRWGERGRSLRLDYDTKSTGWDGYFTLLNQIDGAYLEMTAYERCTFMVRGEKGGELFELGLADRNWMNIGDSLKAGAVDKFLPGGVTTNWQEVSIRLEDFGLLDLSEMGSFVINFFQKGTGTVYIDDLKFHLKETARQERLALQAALNNQGPDRVIDGFEFSQNLLQGRSGDYKMDPSSAHATREPGMAHAGQQALKIVYDKKGEGGPGGKGGWCGYWTSLKTGDNYFDASPYDRLVLWVKGAKGGENFRVGLADKFWEQKEDSIKCKDIVDYLPGGKVTTDWQEAVIPLSEWNVNHAEWATLVIAFETDCYPPTGAQAGTVYLDDLQLRSSKKLIDGFEFSRNLLSGRSGSYKMAPSSANATREPGMAYAGQQSLKLVYDKQGEGGPGNKGGWCGYWTNFKDDKNNYYDATAYSNLIIWVRGDQGGENFRIGLADKFWDQKEDSIKSKDIVQYLPDGKITTEWQKAVIPFADWNIDFKELASMAVAFESDCFPPTGAQQGVVYIDNILLAQ